MVLEVEKLQLLTKSLIYLMHQKSVCCLQIHTIKIMLVYLTADHRVFYGADGASFLKDVASLIEDEPETLVS